MIDPEGEARPSPEGHVTLTAPASAGILHIETIKHRSGGIPLGGFFKAENDITNHEDTVKDQSLKKRDLLHTQLVNKTDKEAFGAKQKIDVELPRRSKPNSLDIKLNFSWVFTWNRAGQGDAYPTCGMFEKWEGCLNVDQHSDGQAVIKRIHYHCYRLECPVCTEPIKGSKYGPSIIRAADRMNHRIESYMQLVKEDPCHYTISPPPKKRFNSYHQMRRKMNEIAEIYGINAAAVIFHPQRQSKKTKKWRIGPHFHLLGFGWIDNVRELYKKTGWIVKNLGVRKSKRERLGTLCYQLSHCGVHKNYHTVTYLGGLSGRKFKAPPMPKKTSTCPECGSFMRPVEPCDPHGTPDQEGTYHLPVLEWIYLSHSMKRMTGSGDRSELEDIYQDLRLN